jgi:hypothetical protein
VAEQVEVSVPDEDSVHVAEGVKVPPVGLMVKVTVPSGEPLFGVGAVSVSVTVQSVVVPYGNEVGLQATVSDTESPVAACPAGSRKAANSIAKTPTRTSLLRPRRFRRSENNSVCFLRSEVSLTPSMKESKATL